MRNYEVCGNCKYLDLEDRSTIGFKCHRPKWIFRKPTASRKHKTTKACKAFESK